MRLLAIGLLFSLIGITTADDPYQCNSLQTIDPPANITFPYIYPPTWDPSQNAPQYASGQNCSWIVNVPVGMFAYVAIKSATSINSLLTLTNSIGNVTKLGGDYNMEPWYFNSPSFIINLNAQTSGKLGFRVAWFKYPDFTPINYQVHQKGDPVIVDTVDLNKAAVFTADTRVSLVALPASLQMLSSYMRATFIFDGPSWNSTFMGTFYDCLTSFAQCVSTGKQLTAFTVFPGFDIGSSVLIQDYEDTKDIVQYRGLVCAIPQNCQIAVQATTGKAAVVTYESEPIYLISASISEKGAMKVYYGKLQESNLVRTYSYNQSKNSFPQKFTGLLTTYIIDRDSATLTFSDKDHSKWNDGRDGRVGFLASQNYLNPLVEFTESDQISGNDNYNYSLNFRQAGITGGAILRLSVLKNDKTTYDQTFTKDNPAPNTLIYAQGNTLRYNFTPNGENTKGFQLDFSMQKINSSTGYGFIVSILVTIVTTFIPSQP